MKFQIINAYQIKKFVENFCVKKLVLIDEGKSLNNSSIITDTFIKK